MNVSHLQATAHIMPSQRVMVRRVTRSSPDSDDTLPGDESEEYRDDAFLVSSNPENNYYVGAGSSGNSSFCSRFFTALGRQLHSMSYLCPGLFPWVDCGPATDLSGLFVIKAVGVLYLLIIVFDLFAAFGNPGTSTFTNVSMLLLVLGIFAILLMISRRPQNRVALIYTTPGLPFVPTIAIIVNIYLILNLSYLTLVRFTFWMAIGLVVYFKYGIINSSMEKKDSDETVEVPPVPNPLDRTTIPPPSPHQSRPTGDRNIFEGDGNEGLYGNMEYNNSLLTWHESNLPPVASSSGFSTPSSGNRMQPMYNPTQPTYRQAETR
ncbi:hypothetical protein SFRURICE_007633 [Spodoptera frugiperda]|uniref:SFRICE_020489 n=1 Tax=Spodoptera frugiperda TaxID=7108 RepID=A0A2H1VHB9_SPOFR|nr:hypothetical protein SFRURICE_007633 [Spodoptera frugiperda]